MIYIIQYLLVAITCSTLGCPEEHNMNRHSMPRGKNNVFTIKLHSLLLHVHHRLPWLPAARLYISYICIHTLSIGTVFMYWKYKMHLALNILCLRCHTRMLQAIIATCGFACACYGINMMKHTEQISFWYCTYTYIRKFSFMTHLSNTVVPLF